MTFIATVSGPGLDFGSEYNRGRWKDYLKDNQGKHLRIQPVSGKVSDKARGYYFGGVIPFMQDLVPAWKELTGEEVHEILKKNFNYFEAFNPLTKRNERYGQSIAVEDTARFQEYLLRIADWVMENYSQSLPDPEDYKRFVDSARLR